MLVFFSGKEHATRRESALRHRRAQVSPQRAEFRRVACRITFGGMISFEEDKRSSLTTLWSKWATL
eukprot:6187605-Pleurochrysis_carterae.AAC.2